MSPAAAPVRGAARRRGWCTSTEGQHVALRPCLDCGTPSARTRCPQHEHQKERARGTTTERGLGAAHQRRLLDPAYLAATHCTECGEPFTEDNPRTGGHVVARRHGGGDGAIAPHCARCNYGWSRTGL